MSDERDQRLAELFEKSTEPLSGEAFAAKVRLRIGRQRTTESVWKVLLVLVLVAIGIFYSSLLDQALLRVETNISQAFERHVFDSPLRRSLSMIVLVSLVVCYLWWRRKRRWM
jgi:hypothetical protein